ncbi:MAG: hypothetical protein QNL88_02270 [Acidobacteriota bacterium]|nr:hypothetical protein [Acidobacteriota bacterium]
MRDLRQQIGREEFDYPALMAALASYANPRDKVTALLRRGDIVRVKKGIYVFGEAFRRRPYSRELLANLIYGPSFVSFDSALSFHGLIPERVSAITSVTTRRPKVFDTPVGSFTYRQAPRGYYHLGMDRLEVGDVAFLIAVPEKALSDKIRDDRGNPLRSQEQMARYLFEDLRIEPSAFLQLDADFLERLAVAAKSQKIGTCVSLLRKMRARR